LGTVERTPTEMVIMIHGTAAGVPDKVNPRWWQSESRFARSLQTDIGPERSLSEPFRWGEYGPNSEVARRLGGEKLLKWLRRLEATGSCYHLVAHSHGGSVVWHALVQSAQEGRRLAGLQSWTTVGTPFLEFGPDPRSLWQISGLISTAIVCALLWPAFSTTIADSSAILSEGRGLALSEVGAFGFLLIAALLFFAFRVLMLASEALMSRRRKAAERQAAAWYGNAWLGLWHSRDEPINGLQATLSETPKLVPRLGKQRENSLLGLLLKPYDLLVAPLADAFAWATIMGKAQGSDEIGKIMLSAGPCPSALDPGWPPLAEPLSAKIADAANLRAGASAGRLRDALAAAAKQRSGQGTLAELANVIGWDEIIHTSYFAAPELGSIVSARVRGQEMPRTVPASYVRQQRSHSWLMQTAFAVVTIVLSVILGLAVNTGYLTTIEPLTDRYQLERIAENLEQLTFTPQLEGDLLGRFIARLQAAEALPIPYPREGTLKYLRNEISLQVYGALRKAESSAHVLIALQRVFFYLGFAGKESDIRGLLFSNPFLLVLQDDKRRLAMFAIAAELGYAKKKNAPPNWLVEVADEIIQSPTDYHQNELAKFVFFYLVRRERYAEVDALLAEMMAPSPSSGLKSICASYDDLRPIVSILSDVAQTDRGLAVARGCHSQEASEVAYVVIDRLMKLGRTDEASRTLSIIQNIQPHVSPRWEDEGVAELLVNQKRYEEAKEWIFRRINNGVEVHTGISKKYSLEPLLRNSLDVGDLLTKAGRAELGREVKTRVSDAAKKSTGRVFASEIGLAAGTLTRADLLEQASMLHNKKDATGQDILDVIALRRLAKASRNEMQEAFREALQTMVAPPSEDEKRYIAIGLVNFVSYMSDDELDDFASIAADTADEQPTVEHRDEVLSALVDILITRKSFRATRLAADRLIAAKSRALAYVKILDQHAGKQRAVDFGFHLADKDLPETLSLQDAFPRK
jgi:hypothetical protein